MANIRDVAKRANVSISTVSRVLNGFANVREGTRQAVLRSMEELGYSSPVSVPIRSQNRTVGIVISSHIGRDLVNHPTIYTILSGASQRLGEEGIKNCLLPLESGMAGERNPLVLNDRLDAYIMIGTEQADEDFLLPRILDRKLPLIAVNRWFSRPGVSSVNIDDEEAERTAVEHLLELGHTRIAFVNGAASLRNSALRLSGFRKAMAERNLSVPDEYIISGQYDEETGYGAAMKLLRTRERPTAVVATSDILAVGLNKGLRESGCRVPREISLVGFGDISLAAYLRPALTTVRVPDYHLGVKAAEVIIDLFKRPEIRQINVIMNTKLVIRGSTGPPFPQPGGGVI